jgi:translation initiation factor 1
MTNQKRFTDFSELQQLLPDAVHRKEERGGKGSNEHDGNGQIVRIAIDRKSRKGKTVTLISGFQHNPTTMEEIARILKQYCGAGGTVKGMAIEIQGDQRDRVTEKLTLLNYDVK